MLPNWVVFLWLYFIRVVTGLFEFYIRKKKMKKIPSIVVLIALAVSNAAFADDTLWDFLPTQSGTVINFQYVDPITTQNYIIDVDASSNVTGSFKTGEPTYDSINDLYTSSFFDLSFTSSLLSGGSGHVTSDGVGSYTVFGGDYRSGFSSFNYLNDQENPTPLSIDYVESGSVVGYTYSLFNTPELRDTNNLSIDNNVALLRDTLGFQTVPELFDEAKASSGLASDWTSMIFFQGANFGLYTYSAQELEDIGDFRGLTIDVAGVQGVVDNGNGTYTVPLTTVVQTVAYTTSPFPEYINAPLPGDENNPLLPNPATDQNPNFEFDFSYLNLDDIIYLDPEVAIGYDYLVGSGPNMKSVILPTDIGDADNLFDLYLFDESLGEYIFSATLTGGVEYAFANGGVDKFRILGIDVDAMIDPTDPTAFVTGLSFTDTGSINLTQSPISEFVDVPVPGTLALVLLGAVGLGVRSKKLVPYKEKSSFHKK